MINYSLLFTVLFSCFLLGCKNDDPNPRDAFIGSYEMNSFDVTVAQGDDNNVFTIASRPGIDCENNDNLQEDELKMDLYEFIDDVLQNSFGKMINPTASLSIDINDETIAKISGADFITDEIDFTMDISDGDLEDSFSCEFEGRGKLASNKLTVNFEITLFTGSDNFIFTGTAIGAKE